MAEATLAERDAPSRLVGKKDDDESHAARRSAAPTRWSSAFAGTRLRVVASYLILLVLACVTSVLAAREVLLLRLEDRVQSSLEQEVAEFDRLYTDGRDPATGSEFSSLDALFDVYFSRNVPGHEEAMVAVIDGQVSHTAAERYPFDGGLPVQVVEISESTPAPEVPGTQTRMGQIATPQGEAYYQATAVRLGNDTGSFLVVAIPAAELDEIANLGSYGLVGAVAVLLLATALAWPIAGRVLAPIQQVTETARRISDSDLTQRIPLRGEGEAAQMARSFNTMLDRLEATFEDQRQFVRDTSHELRDPLTICRGHLELLAAERGDPDGTLALVQDELARMTRIVTDLQVLADARDRDFLRWGTVDLGAFTRELAVKARALGPQQWVLDEVADAWVRMDRFRITEAVMNMAHNAVNHSHPGDRVAIGSSVSDDEWRLWVRDVGVGIPEAELAALFQRYVRGGFARRHYAGAGLGLALVRLVAEAHGGRVEATSDGVGAVFTLVIPIVSTPVELA